MRVDELEGLLPRAGHKSTAARRQILALIADQPGTFTAAELLESLEAHAPYIGRATLFRTLDLLISLGALERVRLPAHQDGYVLCDPHHHHHIVCSSCGSVGEVDSEALEAALHAAVRAAGFSPGTHAFELSGLCPSCAQVGR